MKIISNDEFLRLLKSQPVCILGHPAAEQRVVRINTRVEPPLMAVLCDLVEGYPLVHIATVTARDDQTDSEPEALAEAHGARVLFSSYEGNIESLQFLKPWVVEHDPRVGGVVKLED